MRYLNINISESTMIEGIDKDAAKSANNLSVSRLVLGTDYFGTTVSEKDSFRLMDIYTDAGGNCIDTARLYASWIQGGGGASERTIGKWLKTGKKRDKIVLSTKGGHPILSQMHIGRLARKEILEDLDESLKTMGVDYIDIYWLHRDDEAHPVEDIAETLTTLTASGKVRAVGCSNWKTKRIEEAHQAAHSKGLTAFNASQIQWSLAASTPEVHGDPTIICMNEAEYNWYKERSFPLFAYSSQAKGFFARAAANGIGAINQKASTRFAAPENIARLERVMQLAYRNNITPTAAALGYITCNQLPAVAVVGCKNEDQLRDTLTAADVKLTDAEVDWLFKG